MDVGLSNKNYLGLVAPELVDVKFIVECDGSHDQFNLWREYAPKSSTNIKPLSKDLIDQLAIDLRHDMWKEINTLNKKVIDNNPKRVDSWEEVSSGFMLQIGEVTYGEKTLPVCVSFSFAYINGVKVCFYYECSQARNSKMVEDWFLAKFQLTHDNYTRWNHVDSNNFHNCVNSLDRLDVATRELDTIDLLTPRAIVTNWYPGIKFETGDVLTKIFGNPPSRNDMDAEWRYWDSRFENWIWAESLEDATANYSAIEWYQNRKADEMPLYIKELEGGTVYKVFNHFDSPDHFSFLDSEGDSDLKLYKYCTPATQAEYENYKQHAEV